MRHYTAYTTRDADEPDHRRHRDAGRSGHRRRGGLTDLELGHATYRFRTVLPAGFDRDEDAHARRSTRRATTNAIVGKNYFANVEYDFRPDRSP